MAAASADANSSAERHGYDLNVAMVRRRAGPTTDSSVHALRRSPRARPSDLQVTETNLAWPVEAQGRLGVTGRAGVQEAPTEVPDDRLELLVHRASGLSFVSSFILGHESTFPRISFSWNAPHMLKKASASATLVALRTTSDELLPETQSAASFLRSDARLPGATVAYHL